MTGAAVCTRTALSRAAALLAALALAGCARPTGDFGRAEPSVLHDTVMPAVGLRFAIVRGEPVSRFNWTDVERRVRDRAWALVRPPHTGDWIAEIEVEAQRTRLLPEVDRFIDWRAYYSLLKSDRYRSSEARYARIETDMKIDAELIGPFCADVRRMVEDDRFRLTLLRARADVTAGELAGATARVDENGSLVAWVWRALALRLAAYRNAIERIGVETPSPRHYDLATGWAALSRSVTIAGCGPAGAIKPIVPVGRPSRLVSNPVPPPDEPVPQK